MEYLKDTGRSQGSELPNEQLVRLKKIQMTNAASILNKILLGLDVNLDLSKSNNMNKRYNVKHSSEEYME